MPTIALLSDLHLGLGARAEETRRVNAAVVDVLRARRPDGILIGGDFFDRRSLPEERNEGAALLLDLAALAPVVGVYGNHDAPHDLDVFNHLAGAHPIRFYGAPAVHLCGLLCSDTTAPWSLAIAVLPWQRDAPLPAWLRMSAAERRDVEAAARRELLQRLAAVLDASGAQTKLVLSHVMLTEAQVGVGQPERRGRDFELSLAELAELRADAYLLGHVHRSQDWMIGHAPVIYPGSVVRRSYGEIERKYVALIHIIGGAVSVEWIETGATPMILAETSWAEIEPGRWGFTGDLAELVRDAGAAGGADVRLGYRVDEAHREAAALAASAVVDQLRAAGARMTRAEEEVQPVVRARAPEIARAPTIEGKLAITLEQKGHSAGTAQHDRVLALYRELRGSP